MVEQNEVQVKRSWGRPKGSKNSPEAIAKIRAWHSLPENKAAHAAAIRVGIVKARMQFEKEVE